MVLVKSIHQNRRHVAYRLLLTAYRLPKTANYLTNKWLYVN
jgi:hypothetical protein